MRLNRLNSLVGLLACAGLLFVSTTCASAARRPDMGGVLTIGVQRLPGSINPGTAHDSSSLLAVSAVHAGLYRLQSNGQPELQLLVEQPKRSDNGRRWHCKLRRGLQFHNGKRLRSHDVRDSIERLSETPHRWLTGFLQVIIVDARNFVIQLSRPVSRSELARLLATPALSVLSKNDSPVVGAGPFRVIRRRTRILRLRAVGDHFAGRPYLDAIEFREVSNREELFKYKKVDLILTPTSKLNDAKWLDGPVRETIGLLFHPRNSGHARGDRARFWSQIPRKELVAVVAGDARVAHAFHPLDPPFRPAGKGSAGRGVEGVLMCLESDLNTARRLAESVAIQSHRLTVVPVSPKAFERAQNGKSNTHWDILLVSFVHQDLVQDMARQSLAQMVAAHAGDDAVQQLKAQLLWIPILDRKFTAAVRSNLRGLTWTQDGSLHLENAYKVMP